MTLIPFEFLEIYPDSVAVRVVGASMTPTLLDDDRLLMDISATQPKDREIVGVFIRNSGHMVGRFRQSRNGAWLDKDNPSVASVFLGDATRFVVTGTIRYVIHRPGLPGLIGIPVNVDNALRVTCSSSEIGRRIASAQARFFRSYQHLLDSGSCERGSAVGQIFELEKGGTLGREIGPRSAGSGVSAADRATSPGSPLWRNLHGSNIRRPE